MISTLRSCDSRLVGLGVLLLALLAATVGTYDALAAGIGCEGHFSKATGAAPVMACSGTCPPAYPTCKSVTGVVGAVTTYLCVCENAIGEQVSTHGSGDCVLDVEHELIGGHDSWAPFCENGVCVLDCDDDFDWLGEPFTFACICQ